LVRVLDEQFDEDLERSIRIEAGRWERRNAWQRLSEKLVSPLRRWS
jgi:cardiolipin synthase